MPRTARASVGGTCDRVLNRGNGGAKFFHRRGDDAAFVKLMAEANERCLCESWRMTCHGAVFTLCFGCASVSGVASCAFQRIVACSRVPSRRSKDGKRGRSSFAGSTSSGSSAPSAASASWTEKGTQRPSRQRIGGRLLRVKTSCLLCKGLLYTRNGCNIACRAAENRDEGQ